MGPFLLGGKVNGFIFYILYTITQCGAVFTWGQGKMVLYILYFILYYIVYYKWFNMTCYMVLLTVVFTRGGKACTVSWGTVSRRTKFHRVR